VAKNGGGEEADSRGGAARRPARRTAAEAMAVGIAGAENSRCRVGPPYLLFVSQRETKFGLAQVGVD